MKVDEILFGKIREYGPKGEKSAYRKAPAGSYVDVNRLGIIGDEHADMKHHGGVDKALLHYSFDHYPDWASEFTELKAYFLVPGAFGENLSSSGLTENNVFLGDQYRIGSVVVEVTQGRQPCWKLGHHFSNPAMIKAVIKTGRSGWYYRVIEEGRIALGDEIELLERPHPDLSVAKVFGLLVGKEKDTNALASLVKSPVLSEAWQDRALSRFSKISV